MECRGRGDGSVYQRNDGSWVAQFQEKYRYAQSEDATKQKLYKMLTGAEESKPKNITASSCLTSTYPTLAPTSNLVP